jgi:hypothetical protein
MERIEKTVFVSYRRRDEPWALAVFGDLTHHGYDVFIDYDGIASGNFEAVILENIRARAHFLVLLTPTALERCGDPKDWMRREIEAALDSQRNIVPLMLAGFDFGTPATASQLTGKLAALRQYNGLPIPEGYFPQAMERLRSKFLHVPVDAVLHPASDSAQQVAKEQKDKATMALADKLEDRLPREMRLGTRPWLIAAGVAGASLALLLLLLVWSRPPESASDLPQTKTFTFPKYAGFRLDFCYKFAVIETCGQEAAVRFCNSEHYKSVADKDGFVIDPNIGNTISMADNRYPGRDGFKFIRCVNPKN